MSATIDTQSTDFSEIMADIVDITQELFPGEVSAYLLDDPEYPQGRLTVIEAQAGRRRRSCGAARNGTAAYRGSVNRVRHCVLRSTIRNERRGLH